MYEKLKALHKFIYEVVTFFFTLSVRGLLHVHSMKINYICIGKKTQTAYNNVVLKGSII